MFRLSIRLSKSLYKNVIVSEKADTFFSEVSKNLDKAKNGSRSASSELISYWESVTDRHKLVDNKRKELQQLQELASNESDPELKLMVKEESSILNDEYEDLIDSLAKGVVPLTDTDVLGKCQMEFTSGAGGQEAMLFTGELMEMYRKFSEYRGWKWEPLQLEDVALGGVRSALIAISGESVYSTLRFEAGVHRVQRIPLTDKSRMHTSTASISVLPEPDEVSVVVPSDSVKIETMRASGPGGQNVNKRSTAVRMTHKDTGIAVHCMDERFQHLNIQIAYKRLAAILMQQKVEKQSEKISSDRKLQVGSKARAEKIRTFNFQHDRVTDHRLQIQMSNVSDFMSGGDSLNHIVSRLEEVYCLERLEDIMNSCSIE